MSQPTKPASSESDRKSGGSAPQDQLIQGHRYDGIREYDNPMPGWWVWVFWGTVLFAGIYLLGVHTFGFIDTYERDLAESVSELEQIRTAYAEAHPTFDADETTLATFVEDPGAIDAGHQTYTTYCAACHGDQGQGLIGPNLTDEFWIHGGSNTNVFEIVSTGVAAKGMPAWSASLTPEQRAQVVAFIRSLEGTNPPGARAPEGDPYEPNV